MLEIGAATLVATLLYLPVVWLFSPPPIPSLTTLLGGLLGNAFGARRRGSVPSGAFVGLLLGSALHARVHIVEGRASPLGEFLLHLGAEAALSSAIAGIILLAALHLQTRIARVSPAET